MKVNTIEEGSRVIIIAEEIDGEQLPQERGEVLEVEDDGTLMVCIDEEYRDGEYWEDDGLREVTIEQVRLESELN